ADPVHAAVRRPVEIDGRRLHLGRLDLLARRVGVVLGAGDVETADTQSRRHAPRRGRGYVRVEQDLFDSGRVDLHAAAPEFSADRFGEDGHDAPSPLVALPSVPFTATRRSRTPAWMGAMFVPSLVRAYSARSYWRCFSLLPTSEPATRATSLT